MLTFLVLAHSITTVTVDFSQPGIEVSPLLYGLFTEEINHSYDGGLYGELVRNRSFQDHAERPVHWSAAGSGSTIELDRSGGATEALPVSLKVVGGAANDGYWGMPVKPNMTYRLSVWAKADKPGLIRASLESKDGQTVYAKADLAGVGDSWKKLDVTLTTGSRVTPTTDSRLVLRTGADRTTWLNLVSLFQPTFKDRPNGNRPDLMAMMAEMNPKFLRFPGGNYLEGPRLEDRFEFKRTLGPIEQRPGHWTPWGYRSSDGMGMLEFLLWCKDLNMKPVLGVFAGYTLDKKFIKAGPELQPYVDEALEQIEYVIGGTDTKWGARRAADGHPEPFDLEYVEIGNEDGFDESGSYEDRFVQFYDAIKAKYPDIKVISSTGGTDWLGSKFPITKRKPDLVDEHYYSNHWDMMGMASKYDSFDRNGPKILIGEYAAHVGTPPWEGAAGKGPTPDMLCAMAEAAYLTGLERNSDIVEMACYGPLFVNVNPGGRQWAINLIGYDALNSFGSPSYHAQVMFGQNIGDRTVPVSIAGAPVQRNGERTLPGLFSSVTRDTKTGMVYLKVVNPMSDSQDVTFQMKGAEFEPEGTIITLSGEPTAINSITEREKIVPVRKVLTGIGATFKQTLPPCSVTVMVLKSR